MLKISENPPMLAPGFDSVLALKGNWIVVQTKARAEKALAWCLNATKTGYYLPMVKRATFSGGRKRVGFYPIFSGYLFVCTDNESWHFGLASRHLARIIPVREPGVLAAELHELEQAIAIDSSAVLFPHIVVGQHYRVKAGPLAGLVGPVVELQGSMHVVLNVTVLGQAAAMPVDASFLELLVD